MVLGKLPPRKSPPAEYSPPRKMYFHRRATYSQFESCQISPRRNTYFFYRNLKVVIGAQSWQIIPRFPFVRMKTSPATVTEHILPKLPSNFGGM